MRMRRRNNLAPCMAACEPVWIHEPEALRGNWRSLMTGCRELRVEVGCGKGKFVDIVFLSSRAEGVRPTFG